MSNDLQSLNNELTALNAQLQATAKRQRATSRNLQNILDSTDMPTLVLDADLNIRLFTPAATSLFTVVASDVGRPLADLSRRFDDDKLLADARAVLGSHPPIRREVRADAGGRRPVHSRDATLPGQRKGHRRSGDHVSRHL